MLYFEEAPSGSKILGVLLVGLALVSFLAGHRVRKLPAPLVLCVVITLLAVLSMLWTVDKEDTWKGVQRLIQVLVFALLIWEFVVTYQDQLWVFRIFLLGMLVPAVMMFSSFRGASQMDIESGERFSGGGHNANYLAYMLCDAILIAIYLATNPHPLDRALRWCYWGFAGIAGIEVFLTGSRGGFVALLITGLFALIAAGVSRRRFLAVAQVLALLLVAFLFLRLAASQELRDRITFGGGGGTSVEDDPRVRIINRGLEAFSGNKLLGVGYGAFVTAAFKGEEHAAASHNTFLAYLVELGITGLSLYCIYLVMLFRAIWRLPRREKWMWLGILSISLTLAVGGGSTIDKLTWFLYAMALVQSAALAQPGRKRRAKPASRGVVLRGIAPLRPDLRKPG
jgi:O-antigen ligase